MTILFQPITSDACSGVQATALAAWQATYHAIFDADTIRNYVATYYAMEHLQSLVVPATSGQIYFETVAEDERIVGFCHIGVQQNEGYLFRIYLLPEAQGRGLGSAFLERGEHWLRQQHIFSYGCFVHPANTPALRFYERSGFVAVPERDAGDGLWYSKTIQSSDSEGNE